MEGRCTDLPSKERIDQLTTPVMGMMQKAGGTATPKLGDAARLLAIGPDGQGDHRGTEGGE